MKILITGAFGQLGNALYNTLSHEHNVIRTGRNTNHNIEGLTLDVQNKLLLKDIIHTTEPDLVINLAAMTNVDNCELKPDLAREINIAGLINICENFDGKIIQLSSDYVFDGNNGPYSERDITNPISIYGETKLASERILLGFNSDNLVIRGNVLYDYMPFTNASFVNWVIDSLVDNNKISVVNDQFNNPTWVQSMAEIINLCILNNLNGIVHWGDADFISRYEFALKIAEKFSLKSSLIQPITTQKLNQKAQRPLKSGLKSDKLIKLLNVVPPTINECLEKITRNLK